MGHRSTAARGIGLSVLLIGALGGAGQAWAYDDGYQNVFSSVLTAVGVLPKEEAPEIDYRERPPLVLPPKQDLSKPEKPGANRTASWPQDPDVIARRKASAEARAPLASMFDKSQTNERAESKEEMLKHRAAETVVADRDGCQSFDHSDAHCRLTPDQMRKQDELYRASNPEVKDVATAGVEPERLYLTQPPKGYMKATKTVRATAEAPHIVRDESSPLSTLIQRPHVDEVDSPNQ